MYVNPEDRMQEIEKEFLKVGIINAPGTAMVGWGVYGKFGANGDAFHPVLNDPTNTTILLIVGAAIIVWGSYKFIRLGREKSKLVKKHDL